MISIIICTKHGRIPIKLKDNITSTIGCDYEIVCIDNSENHYSIFQAYNKGVSLAKGDILCFMHDDIHILTPNWGKLVKQHLCDKVGLIGVIGNHLLPNCPASWWTTSMRSGHIIQRNLTDDRSYDILFDLYKSSSLNYSEVVTIDGLWFCMPKKIFEEVHFDEKTFSGFHCYDSDICMQTLMMGYSVRTIFDITIEHYSIGSLDKQFFAQRQLWYEKWEQHLPIVRGISLSPNELMIVTEMSKLSNELLEEKTWAEEENKRIKNSHAYKLGETILKPIKWLKK